MGGDPAHLTTVAASVAGTVARTIVLEEPDDAASCSCAFVERIHRELKRR